MDTTVLVNIYNQAPAIWFILWAIWTIVTIIIALRTRRAVQSEFFEGSIGQMLGIGFNVLLYIGYSTMLGIAYFTTLAQQMH